MDNQFLNFGKPLISMRGLFLYKQVLCSRQTNKQNSCLILLPFFVGTFTGIFYFMKKQFPD